MTLAADTAYYFVADALGFRRSPVQTLDTTSQLSATVSLEAIVDAQGNELIRHELDADETAQAALIEWGAEFIDIDADGVDDVISYEALVYAVEQGQSTAAACGSLLEPARIEVGRVVIPAGSDQRFRSKATLSNDAVSTAIDNAAGYSAGDTDIVVDSVTGLTAGMTVVIAEGESDEEAAEIDSINTGTNTLTLTAGLANAHDDNTTVTRDKSYPDLQSTGLFKDGAADQEDYIDFSNGPLKVKTEAPVFATVTGTRQADFQGYLDNYANKDDWKAAAADIGGLEVTDDLNLIAAVSVLLGVAVGRVEEDPGDSTMLKVYSAIDDEHVITLPKFVGDARAAGATVP